MIDHAVLRKTGRSASILLACVFLLCGCKKNAEERIYEAFKCTRVANQLDHADETKNALAKMEVDLKAMEPRNLATLAKDMQERLDAEVPLERYTADERLAALTAIYESDACQALYAPDLLDLSATTSPAAQAAAVQPAPQGGTGTTGVRTSPAAVLKVAREYVADAQDALLSNSVVAYCRAFAPELSQPQDLQDCLRLVEMPPSQTNGLPTPASAGQVVSQAESLAIVQRFAYCTSDPVVRYFTSFADYDRCMPESFDTLLTRELSAFRDLANESAGVGPAAFPYNNPLGSASQLDKDERVAYCGIPAVQGQLEPAELRECVDGQGANGTAPPEATSTPRPMDGLARSAMLKAAQFDTQEERDAFCNRHDVRVLLTPSQVQECEAGLSPDDPPAGGSSDDDPGYQDEGH